MRLQKMAVKNSEGEIFTGSRLLFRNYQWSLQLYHAQQCHRAHCRKMSILWNIRSSRCRKYTQRHFANSEKVHNTIMLWFIGFCQQMSFFAGDNPFKVPWCMLLCFSAITMCDVVRCSACRIWSMRCRPSTWTVLVISILKLGYCKFVVRYMYIIFSCWPFLSFWLHGNYLSLILPSNCYSQDVWCRSVRCWRRRSRRI